MLMEVRLENGQNSFEYNLLTNEKGKEEIVILCQDRDLNLIEGITHEIIEAHINSLIKRFTGNYSANCWVKGYRVPHIVAVLGSDSYKKMIHEYNRVEMDCDMKLV